MRNTTDAALLKESAFRQQAAEAIADGLAVYLARR
jgi:N-acetylmuramoyl-L-alanine amidase